MTALKLFLQKHTSTLDTYISLGNRIPEQGPQIIKFIDSVLDEWQEIHQDISSTTNRTEMTFWYCLYQLELLAELDPTIPLHPFEQTSLDQLLALHPLLLMQKPLPAVYYASRPGDLYTDQVGLDCADILH